VRGDTNVVAFSLWGRLRWPTGLEAFDRPVRWVVEGQHSRFFGEPEDALGFNYLSKVGGGLELDLGALRSAPSAPKCNACGWSDAMFSRRTSLDSPSAWG
jgi:hypothetical protein